MTPNPDDPLVQKAQDLLKLSEGLPSHQVLFATNLAKQLLGGAAMSSNQKMWVRLLHHRALVPVDPPIPYSHGLCAACGGAPNVEGGPGFYSKGVCKACAPRYQND